MLGLGLGISYRGGGGTRPALDLNFLGGALDSRITFTRASAGWAYNSAGTLTSYAINAPRFDYDPVTLAAKGLLIEEARTNSMRNSSGGGSVAGTSGTLPTNWNQPSITTGITRTIVGSGTVNGLPYVDIQYSGTASGATDTATFYESSSNIVAANLATWTASTHIAFVGGSLSGVTVKQGLRYRAAAGASIPSQVFETTIVPTSTLTRYATTATASDATVAFVVPTLTLTLAVGAIDVTIRHAVPQIELGAFATSPILTTTVAVTRSADVASVTTITPWFNATAGTLMVEAVRRGLTASSHFVHFSDGTTSNFMAFVNGSTATQQRFDVVTATVAQAQLIMTAGGAVDTPYKMAAAYAANDFAGSLNGGTVLTDVSGTVPSGMTTLGIGRNVGSTIFINGHIRSIRYYSSRLPNATLVRITT
jgi:hypothetical protein